MAGCNRPPLNLLILPDMLVSLSSCSRQVNELMGWTRYLQLSVSLLQYYPIW